MDRAPLVVAVGVVQLAAAVVGARTNRVERVSVCCAVQARVLGVASDHVPVLRRNRAADYAGYWLELFAESEAKRFVQHGPDALVPRLKVGEHHQMHGVADCLGPAS